MSLKYITAKKLAEESGYTEAALRAKVLRGEFAEGLHYRKSPDGRIQFNVEEYTKWVESQSIGVKSKSRSTGTGKDTVQQSTSHLQRQTPSMRAA
jgi:hypothetical protein